MGVLNETRHAAAALLLHHGPLSIENVIVLSGENLAANLVIGRVAKGVGRASMPTVVGTGNGTMSQVFAGPDIEQGNYVVKLKTVVANGGVFSVTSPSGEALPDFTLTPGAGGTSLYRSSHINFSITDGSTDFAVDDIFTIVVGTTAPVVIGTGNGTISAMTLGPDAKSGNYRVEITAAILNGGEFKVTGPDGDMVEAGFIVAGAGGTFVGANKRQLNFTITEGSTDFAVGDAFNVAVFNTGEAELGKVVAWDPTAVDGRQRVAGILLGAVNASSGDQPGVAVVRAAAVDAALLSYLAAVTAEQKDSAVQELARKGISAR